nr:arylesterase [Pontibacter vulgaris]
MLTGIYSCGQTESADTAAVIDKEGAAKADKEVAKTTKDKTILFFGNSLTAGYGLEPDQAFPAIIQGYIDSLDLPYKVINAGVSGETSAGGKSRISWLLKQPVDVFVLELGANDGLRGISPTDTYQNLGTIIDKVREKNPDVKIVLAGMQMPPSMGRNFTDEFKQVYTRLAEEKKVALIPFLLHGVGGNPKLNQADGVHPTIEGQKILAKNTWEILENLITTQP